MLAQGHPYPDAMPRERFRLATFNVHHCRGRDGRVDVERTARVILSLRVHLIALQELDRNLSRSGHIDEPAVLSEHTGFRVAFHPTLTIEQGEYGIAIATREGLETAVQHLPRREKEEPRVVVEARWRGLSVLTTHLARDVTARATQIEALATMVGGVPPPVVVLGDLNERRGGLGPLRDAGLHPGPRPWPSLKFPTGAIDHVLVGPELTILRARRVPTVASDHLPLVVDIEIGRGQ